MAKAEVCSDRNRQGNLINARSERRPVMSADLAVLSKAQIPLCRLPRDVRDKPVTSPLAQIPSRRLPRNFPRVCRGVVADVTEKAA